MADFPIIQKPPFKAPCNRCGECCKAGPCDLAADFLDAENGVPCHALEIEEDGRFSCGLFKRPAHYLNPQLPEDEFRAVGLSEMIARFLGFGHGCQMEDATDLPF